MVLPTPKIPLKVTARGIASSCELQGDSRTDRVPFFVFSISRCAYNCAIGFVLVYKRLAPDPHRIEPRRPEQAAQLAVGHFVLLGEVDHADQAFVADTSQLGVEPLQHFFMRHLAIPPARLCWMVLVYARF